MSCSGSEVVDVCKKIMAARQKKQRQVKDSWLCRESLRVPDLVWPRLWIRVALKTSETVAKRDATFSWTSVSKQWIANWKDIFWITGVHQNSRKLLPSCWILNMSINEQLMNEAEYLSLWSIMEIEEGVIRRGRRPRRITPSEISIILHLIRKLNSIVLLFIQNNS